MPACPSICLADCVTLHHAGRAGTVEDCAVGRKNVQSEINCSRPDYIQVGCFHGCPQSRTSVMSPAMSFPKMDEVNLPVLLAFHHPGVYFFFFPLVVYHFNQKSLRFSGPTDISMQVPQLPSTYVQQYLTILHFQTKNFEYVAGI